MCLGVRLSGSDPIVTIQSGNLCWGEEKLGLDTTFPILPPERWGVFGVGTIELSSVYVIRAINCLTNIWLMSACSADFISSNKAHSEAFHSPTRVDV